MRGVRWNGPACVASWRRSRRGGVRAVRRSEPAGSQDGNGPRSERTTSQSAVRRIRVPESCPLSRVAAVHPGSAPKVSFHLHRRLNAAADIRPDHVVRQRCERRRPSAGVARSAARWWRGGRGARRAVHDTCGAQHQPPRSGPSRAVWLPCASRRRCSPVRHRCPDSPGRRDASHDRPRYGCCCGDACSCRACECPPRCGCGSS
jgi:hypothetical protein